MRRLGDVPLDAARQHEASWSASRQVAIAVMRQAVKEEVATRKLPEDLEGLLEAEMWRPEFLPLRRAPGQ